jgi:predicted enzyme related to lactoylglutathione lyase
VRGENQMRVRSLAAQLEAVRRNAGASDNLEESVSEEERPKLFEIGQIAVNVTDLNRAVEFYRDSLGLLFLFQVPGMAFFECAGVRLMLGVPENGDEIRTSSIIYFRVEDIESTSRAMVESGTVFKTEPRLVARMDDHDLWMAFFEDSEGNTLALMSEVRKDGR